jgi:hypothetical protein
MFDAGHLPNCASTAEVLSEWLHQSRRLILFPVCLNALESPLKVLQVIWDACGGKYGYCPLLRRDAAVLSCINTTVLSMRDVGIRFCRNICKLRPDYKTLCHRRVNTQIVMTLYAITLELICIFIIRSLYYTASNVKCLE